jgi:hypothetical protein
MKPLLIFLIQTDISLEHVITRKWCKRLGWLWRFEIGPGSMDCEMSSPTQLSRPSPPPASDRNNCDNIKPTGCERNISSFCYHISSLVYQELRVYEICRLLVARVMKHVFNIKTNYWRPVRVVCLLCSYVSNYRITVYKSPITEYEGSSPLIQKAQIRVFCCPLCSHTFLRNVLPSNRGSPFTARQNIWYKLCYVSLLYLCCGPVFLVFWKVEGVITLSEFYSERNFQNLLFIMNLLLFVCVLTHSDFDTVSSQFSDFAYINPCSRIYLLNI